VSDRSRSTRRGFLAGTAGVAAATGLAACSGSGDSGAAGAAVRPAPVTASPTGPTGPTGPASLAGTSPAPATAAAGDGPDLVPGGPALAVAHGPRDRPQVALTFHLGPHEAGQDIGLAHQLLTEATQLSVPLTVFVVGQWLDAHRDLVPALLAGGNELANHTFTHPTLTALAPAAVSTEIVGCRDVLARLAPTEGRYFRPSGTSTATPTILTAAGTAGYRTVVDFDVDPLDYTSPGADAVVARVRAATRPGSIVSMHFGYPGTVSAFGRIVANLRAAGLTPVRVQDLLTG
jgi:peptidoglycan/xylan/chitin deacetylase (PgdA/CDA1 family)